MKTKITDYRGWEISFDTDKEKFIAFSDEYDRDETKVSFAATKKFIDDFLKENEVFKPFTVECKPTSWNRHPKIKIIGIRKDNRFIYEDSKGEKCQLSEHNEDNYFMPDATTKEAYGRIALIEEKKKSLELEIKEIQNSMTGKCLTEIKKTLIANL